MTRSRLEIKKKVKKSKRGITEKKEKIKKVKDTILRYSHIGIYVRISTSYVKHEVCTAATDKQRNTKTYRVKTKIRNKKQTQRRITADLS